MKEELEKFKKEEEQTDRMLASNLDKKPKHSVHMPTIMKTKKDSKVPGSNSMFGMMNSSSKAFNNAVPGTVSSLH